MTVSHQRDEDPRDRPRRLHKVHRWVEGRLRPYLIDLDDPSFGEPMEGS